MQRQKHIYLEILLILIFFLIIFPGCAKKEAIKKVSDDDVLRQRVMVYWNAMINEEYEKMYEIEYPLFKKETTRSKYIRFMSNPSMKYDSYEIIDIKRVDADVSEVNGKVNVTLKPFGAKPLTVDRVLSERWVRVEGEWYHVPGRLTPGYR